ncbi:MAG TPA: tRNA pseudouridine(38-40) synthase TruA [Kofleriaceae bacterium]
MRNIRLVVEYDGTGLYGWQRQAKGPTVQQHLEEALAQILTHEVKIIGASRTDSGVHARGQVALFRTERPITLHGIRMGANSKLPPQIAIVEATEVDDAFHPRFSASGKHYRYTLLLRASRSPHARDTAWHHPDPLDLEAMREAATHLIGDHDFAAFRAAGCSAKTTIRRIESITLTRAPELLTVDIRGNAFLRQMVRIIVGTLVDVGNHRKTPAQVSEILASLDRAKAGLTAPAHGLELVEVRYDGSRVSSGRDSR